MSNVILPGETASDTVRRLVTHENRHLLAWSFVMDWPVRYFGVSEIEEGTMTSYQLESYVQRALDHGYVDQDTLESMIEYMLDINE